MRDIASQLFELHVRDEQISALRAELAQVRMESSGTYCAYCGQRFAFDGKAAELVSEHIRTCEMHPMRAASAELAQARQRIAELENTCLMIEAESIKGRSNPRTSLIIIKALVDGAILTIPTPPAEEVKG